MRLGISMLLWLACTAPSPAPPSEPSPAPPPEPSPVAPSPPPLWRVDLHVDTLTELADRAVHFDDPGLQSGLLAMNKGETNVIVNVLWPPREGDHEAYTFTQLERLQSELALVSERMVLARSPAEVDTIVASGATATLLALEGAHGIERTGIEGLHKLHDAGLSVLGLTWSLSNRFAGSSGDGGGGLTADGRALVAEAERLGILVDVSHASRQTTLDVCAVAKSPLLATHSNAAAVHAVPRNLSDEEIACIAASGGLIGVMFHAPFVAQGEVGIAAVADQFDALIARAGIDHVGLGSDFDGDITVPKGLPDAASLPALWAELRRRGRDDVAIDKLRGANFRRVWSDALRP